MIVNSSVQVIDEASLPHFIRREGSGSGSSRHPGQANENCYSLEHPFHRELYDYIKEQSLVGEPIQPVKQGSFHVRVPDPPLEGTEIAKNIESELHKLEHSNSSLSDSVNGMKIKCGDWDPDLTRLSSPPPLRHETQCDPIMDFYDIKMYGAGRGPACYKSMWFTVESRKKLLHCIY